MCVRCVQCGLSCKIVLGILDFKGFRTHKIKFFNPWHRTGVFDLLELRQQSHLRATLQKDGEIRKNLVVNENSFLRPLFLWNPQLDSVQLTLKVIIFGALENASKWLETLAMNRLVPHCSCGVRYSSVEFCVKSALNIIF